MTYIKLEKAKIRSKRVTLGVTANRTTLRIGVGILEELGWNNYAKIAIFMGEGEDSGKMKFSPSVAGFVLNGTNYSGQKYIQFNAFSLEKKHRAQLCGYKVDGSDLYIDLPDWALEELKDD
jgi:hypothetical protein